MSQPTIPGVYIQEIPNLPPSIVDVPTAIPAFIGYTETAMQYTTDDLHLKPFLIENIMDFTRFFGGGPDEAGVSVAFATDGTAVATVDEEKRSKFLLYYCLQTFFDNGGGQCYIVSVGTYPADGTSIVGENDLAAGLAVIENVEDITLIVFPDSMGLANYQAYYDLHLKAIAQCVKLQNRFAVMDLYRSKVGTGTPAVDNSTPGWQADVNKMRNVSADPANPATGGISGTVDDLKYAAVYFPRIKTTIDFNYDEAKTTVTGAGAAATLAALKTSQNQNYNIAKNAITDSLSMLLPVSGAVVGVYAKTDDARGVWKAPANVNILDAIDLEVKINNADQSNLNVDPVSGYSVNAIRYFPGRGSAIIWGARTLAGNDNEWRYIPVRRFFTMVEQSVKNACAQFVFEPNDMNTWVRVKAMITNYLMEQWKSGALMGSTAQEAFYVHIGLGQTMTEQDIWEGRLIVQIGMAAVRPAEFIILQFVQKMLNQS